MREFIIAQTLCLLATSVLVNGFMAKSDMLIS